MARLKAVSSRLNILPGRFMYQATDDHCRTRHRDRTQPWRAWYKTARWQRLRREVLMRDAYTCKATGVMLIGKYPAPNSPVADHKLPHRGDPKLFWDIDNIEAVSKEYHDREKQIMEMHGRV